MSLSLIIGCLWVLAATVTAMLPMRRQYPPGIALLVIAPFLLGFIAYQHSFWIVGVCLLAFVSMFRRPLAYFYRRARGLPVSLPPELADEESS